MPTKGCLTKPFVGISMSVIQLYLCAVIERDPACAGLQASPALRRALTACFLHDGEGANACELPGHSVIRARTFADIKVGDADLYKIRDRRRCVRRINVFTVYIKHTVSRICIRASLGVCKHSERAFLRLGIRPGLSDTVYLRSGCACIGRGRAAKLRRHLLGEVTHPGIHPVARTGLVGKPSVDGQNHLAGLRLIGESLVLITEPDEFRFSVALANVYAQGDEFLIDRISERIRLCGIGRAFDGDRPLIVGVGGRTPGTVFLLNI